MQRRTDKLAWSPRWTHVQRKGREPQLQWTTNRTAPRGSTAGTGRPWCKPPGSEFKWTLGYSSYSKDRALLEWQRRGWRSGKISTSQPEGPRFNPRPRRGLGICVPPFPAEVHSAFYPSEVGKMSTSIHGPRLPKAPICAFGPLGVLNL